MGDAKLADLGSGVQGLAFFTSGGFSQGFSISSGSLSMSMTLDFGTLGGSIPSGTLIPVGWAFTMTPSSGAGITSWKLAFQLGSTPRGLDYGSASGSGAGSGTVSGSGTFPVTTTIGSGSTLYESVVLSLSLDGNPGFVQITVPSLTSWDFQSVAASTVPEPASVGMIGAGLAFLGTLIRRRRKQ